MISLKSLRFSEKDNVLPLIEGGKEFLYPMEKAPVPGLLPVVRHFFCGQCGCFG